MHHDSISHKITLGDHLVETRDAICRRVGAGARRRHLGTTPLTHVLRLRSVDVDTRVSCNLTSITF
jgi:hypothetical protein